MPSALDELEVSFAIPSDADGLKEVIRNTEKMTEVITKHGPEGMAKFNAAYNEACETVNGGKDKAEIDEQIATQVEAAIHEIWRENGVETKGRLNLSPDAVDAELNAMVAKYPRYAKDAPGHALKGVYRNTAEALQAVYAHEQPSKAQGMANLEGLNTKFEQHEAIQAAYSSHIGSAGGFLMPEEFRQQILEIAHEEAVVRPRATVIPMGAPKVTIPAIHETSRASTLFGGIQVYWTEEEAASTASEAKFRTIALEPDTMTGYAEIPNETMRDTIAFDAYFNATFPRAMAYEEDYAFLQGNGVGRPLGFLKAGCKVEVPAEAAQGADTIVYENILEMWARLPSASMQRAVWVVNQDATRELGTMALSVGTGGAPVFVVNASTGLPMTLLGRPIIYTEKVNTIGDAGDIALIDPSFYLIGDLQAITATSSEHYLFKDRKTAFSIVSRVDGKPWLESAITPRHGANDLSPIVTLAERA